jgi:hypothetical protein
MKFSIGDKIKLIGTDDAGVIKDTGPYDYPFIITPEYLVEYTRIDNKLHTGWFWEDELEKV